MEFTAEFTGFIQSFNLLICLFVCFCVRVGLVAPVSSPGTCCVNQTGLRPSETHLPPPLEFEPPCPTICITCNVSCKAVCQPQIALKFCFSVKVFCFPFFFGECLTKIRIAFNFSSRNRTSGNSQAYYCCFFSFLSFWFFH